MEGGLPGAFSASPFSRAHQCPIHLSLGIVYRKAPCKGPLSQSQADWLFCPERANRSGRELGSHSRHPRGARKIRMGTQGGRVLAGPRLALPGGTSDSQARTGGISSRSRNQTRKCGREKHSIREVGFILKVYVQVRIVSHSDPSRYLMLTLTSESGPGPDTMVCTL